jgi:hypothetical protein
MNVSLQDKKLKRTNDGYSLQIFIDCNLNTSEKDNPFPKLALSKTGERAKGKCGMMMATFGARTTHDC